MDANRQARDGAQSRNSDLIFTAPRGLARRMLVWIICISTTAALIATSVQLFFDYRSDVSELEQAMRYIEQSQLPGLADAAWNFNVAGMQVQLDGIGRSPWVAGATIHYGPSQSAALTTGQLDADAGRRFKYVLRRNGVVVGKIYIEPNLRTLYSRTLDRIGIVLATQGGKSLVTSISILLLISWMITRHLTQMAAFARSFEPGKSFTPFVLRRRPQGLRDELSVLVDGLNDAYARLQKAHEFQVRHNEILSQEVELRTAELLEAHQQLALLAVTDKLTGAVNRRGLDEVFKNAMALAEPERRPLAIILTDIDRFKSVNDSRGHLAGDKLLQEFTCILNRAVRATDTVGRWGGEEFLIVCPQTTLEQALRLAEHMRASVQAHAFAGIGSKTSSFGVAVLRQGETADDLVRRADEALYQAKKSGRNRVCSEAPDIVS